jgi:hypothetical protein
MNQLTRCALLGIAIFGFSQASFAEINQCNNLPADVVAAEPQMTGCVPPATPLQAPCDRPQLDVKQFFNHEQILPVAEDGETYYEGKIRARNAAAGTKRFVFLYDGDEISEKYYTSDHYQTFCRI